FEIDYILRSGMTTYPESRSSDSSSLFPYPVRHLSYIVTVRSRADKHPGPGIFFQPFSSCFFIVIKSSYRRTAVKWFTQNYTPLKELIRRFLKPHLVKMLAPPTRVILICPIQIHMTVTIRFPNTQSSVAS